MSSLKEMYRRTTSCQGFNKMLRSVEHFSNYFGLNHFYYSRVLASGEFASIGSHCEWHEYAFDHPEDVWALPLINDFPNQKSGVIFLKNSSDKRQSSIVDGAYSKFNIHLTICINRKTTHTLESFGFGANPQNFTAGEHLLKELPLVNKFLDYFLEENRDLIRLVHENQVNIPSKPSTGGISSFSPSNNERDLLLKQLKLDVYKTLTEREREILHYVAQGYPAKYIASVLFLSARTIEHHIATIKSKFKCQSKIDLLKRAKEYSALF